MMGLDQESPTAAHWSKAQYEGMLTTRDPLSQRRGWVVELPAQEENSTELPLLLGFLIAHRIDAEWELENIAVSGTARRYGVGARLLSEFIEHVRAESGSAIFLEVRESNHAARSLYRKAGFEETGVRRNYYGDPGENAVLYRRRIS
jgi:ribosomal-protein-alanine acetyltransferase